MNRIDFHKSRGVSLIEILIAALVLSIGLLGLASLQGFSLQAGQGAYHRTQATNLAYEIADFTRLNRSAVLSSCNIPVRDAWDNFAEAQLPDGGIDIVFDCDTGELEISVTWSEERIEDAEDSGESLVVTTRI